MKWRFVFLSSVAVALAAGAHAQRTELPVREFVQARSFPASYEELAASYDASVTAELIELLNAPAEEPNWTRIAGTLGAVSDERAVDALIAFVEKPLGDGRLSYFHEDAYRQAILSLGLLVNRIGSDRALTYLIDGLTPTVWRQRGYERLHPG